MSLRPQCIENSGEFNSDVPCTHDSDPLWLFLKMKEPVRVDTVFIARNVCRERRITAYSDANVFSVQNLGSTPIGECNLDLAWFQELGGARKIVAVVLLQVPFVYPIQSLNIRIPLLLESDPIETRHSTRDMESILWCISEMFRHIRRIPHDLLWNATNIDLHNQRKLPKVIHKFHRVARSFL